MSDINDPYAQHHQLYQQHQQQSTSYQQPLDNHGHNNHHGHSHGSSSHHRNQIGHAQPYYSTYNELNNSGGIHQPPSPPQQYNQYNNNNTNSNSNSNQYNNHFNQYNNTNNNNGFFSIDKSNGLTLNHLLNNLNRDNDAKKLAGWICVMLLFTIYEIFYGAYLESLGLVSDGFHALFDCIGLFIALLGMLVGKKGSDSDYTYGYDRWEVLGTFSNGAFLIFVSFFLFLESIERLLEPPHIHNHGRVISLATFSLLINIIGFIFFKQKTNERKSSIRNENLLTISQHILIDSCTSLGVIISTIVGSVFGLEISDSLISIIIACIIVYNAVPICVKTSGILLQKTPEPLILNINNALKDVAVMNGVLEIKEKHFWSHSIGNNVGTLQLSVKMNCDDEWLLNSIRNRLSFIQDLTIQLNRNDGHSHKHHHDEQKSNKHSHNHHDHDHNHDHHDHHHDHHDHHHDHHDHDHDHHNNSSNNNEPIPLYQVQQTPTATSPPTNYYQQQNLPNNQIYPPSSTRIIDNPTSPTPLYNQNEPEEHHQHHHDHDHDEHHHESDEDENDPYSHRHHNRHSHGHSHNNNQSHGHSHNDHGHAHNN